MNYKLIGNVVPAVEITMNRGEIMYTQSGGMMYCDDGVQMSTNARGGLMKGLARAFAGESIFMANYTAQKDGAVIAFASTVPGKVIPVNVSEIPSGLTVQKGAFLCAENSVNLEVTFSKKFGAGLFGGEGFILQRVSGSGMLFLEVDGDVVEKQLAPGEVLKVDTGSVVAFEGGVSYDIETVKGLGNVFLGGEGLFLTKLTGPGKVLLQTQNFSEFAGRIIPYIPSK